MIKECDVILHNTATLVVDFDGKQIQMPRTDNVDKTVYVEYKDGKYLLCSKDAYEKSLRQKFEKKSKKVKTDELILNASCPEASVVEDEKDEVLS